MAKTAEEKCLNALKTVMQNRFNDEDYIVIGEYAECATCLEKKDDKWELYHGERLNHYNSEFFTDIITACLAAIEKAGNSDDMSEAKQEFVTLITDTEKCIDALKKVMLHHYEKEDYIAIGGYSECSVCLEKKDDTWEVYFGERMSHFDSKFFSDILTACLAAIEKVGYPKDMSEAKQEFTTLITDTEKYA